MSSAKVDLFIRILNGTSFMLVLALIAVTMNAYSNSVQDAPIGRGVSLDSVSLELTNARERMTDKMRLLGKPEPETLELNDVLNALPQSELDNALIVDLRPRELFAQSHIRGSISIPLDELKIRAKHEIPENRPIVVFCGMSDNCERSTEQNGYPSPCKFAAHQIQLDTTHEQIYMLSTVIGTVPSRLIEIGPQPRPVLEWIAKS